MVPEEDPKTAGKRLLSYSYRYLPRRGTNIDTNNPLGFI